MSLKWSFATENHLKQQTQSAYFSVQPTWSISTTSIHPDLKIGFFILISINATKARNSETEPQLVCSKLTIETLKQGVKYVKS